MKMACKRRYLLITIVIDRSAKLQNKTIRLYKYKERSLIESHRCRPMFRFDKRRAEACVIRVNL